jgi:GT2 family glycosyltransferase
MQQRNSKAYDVIIAIPNNNHSALLEQCVSSILATVRRSSYLIAILDNCSSDNSVDMIKTKFPMVKLIEQKQKRGFVQNMNTLISTFAHEGRYFLMLNDDTRLLPGAIDELVRFMDRHPSVGAVVPKMYYPDGRVQPSGWPHPTIPKEIWRYSGLGLLVGTQTRRFIGEWLTPLLSRSLKSYFRSFTEKQRPRTIGYGSGACLLIRGTTLDAVGPLSLEFNMYGEDADWCRRAKQCGWKIAINPRAAIVHLGMQSYSRYSIVEFERSSLKYLKKYHASPYSIFLYRLIIIAISLCKIIGAFLGLQSSLQRRVPRAERISAYREVISIMLRGA